MADRIPLKAVFTNGTPTALGEFNPGDTLPVAHGGTAATTAETARSNLGLGSAATRNVGTTSGTVAAGDDGRLSDARTPVLHAASHASAGADAITPAAIGAATDNHQHSGVYEPVDATILRSAQIGSTLMAHAATATSQEMIAGQESGLRAVSPLLVADAIAARSSTIISVAYADRADLRAIEGNTYPTYAVVAGLGLFIYRGGSDEIDDDETCFVTTHGAWVLEAPHWDLIAAWQAPDDLIAQQSIMHGYALCPYTKFASGVVELVFTGTVIGAAVGDRVLLTPPYPLTQDVNKSALVSARAWVSAANTVSIQLAQTNTLANAEFPLHAATQTAWPLTVFREV